jgi:Ala-tRNA(Pro) deacylase
MSLSPKLENYLHTAGAPYEHHVHPTAYTARETADVMHIPLQEMAKCVVVKADGRLVMAVVPADRTVDVPHLKFVTRAENIGLATEAEFADAFPSCEIGAMPPFGNLFGVPTYCDTLLEENGSIEFNAGTHQDSIRMAFDDYKRCGKPTMIDLVEHGMSGANVSPIGRNHPEI